MEIIENKENTSYEKIVKSYNYLNSEKRELQYEFVSSKDNTDKTELINKNPKIQIEEKNLRNSAKDLIKEENSKIEVNDRDYIFLYFIINYLPNGLIGLLLARYN